MAVVLLHSDILVDSSALRAALPAAQAGVLAGWHGGDAASWQRAYERVIADWDSYWVDLDLNGDDSLQQWREGRWRVIRALFRLAGQRPPPVEQMGRYLDDINREVGRGCGSAWRAGARACVEALAARRQRTAIVTPTLTSGLVLGMLDAVGLPGHVEAVVGPDELRQVGLDGITSATLADLAGARGEPCVMVGRAQVAGLRAIAAPEDLAALPDLLNLQGVWDDDRSVRAGVG